MSEVINLNGSSPAAPAGKKNAAWQKGAQTGTDEATGLPIFPVSANVDATGVLGIVIDGGGGAPTTGPKGFIQIPWACTITGWTMLADTSGSAQVTVKKSTYSAFPTQSSIVASAPPNLSSAQKNTSTTLTGWATSISAGDVLGFNLDSVTTCTRIIMELQYTRV